MYTGYQKAERVCMHVGPLQATYTSVTPKKNENQQSNTSREYWYGRPTSLKDTKDYKNLENSK
jgi:hypothetical protein